jgi:hypothetical protein
VASADENEKKLRISIMTQESFQPVFCELVEEAESFFCALES